MSPAPFLPFAAEEVWSWWQDGSVHRSQWPTRAELAAGSADDTVLESACTAIALVRRAKTEAKVSQRAAVTSLTISADAATLTALARALDDVIDAGSVAAHELRESEGPLEVAVTLESA